MTVSHSSHPSGKTVKTTIDGREVEVARDRWALEVAREMGISIPTLCYHPALEPYGSCRLCVVEVKRGRWAWLTTSCDLPIREGLVIRTNTPEVVKARRMALELLWSQAPKSKQIEQLAREYGLEKPRFASRDGENQCILCGLCVRVCEQLVGVSGIGFNRRGIQRTVGSPFGEGSPACIGCQACAAVCPTGHVRGVLDGATQRLDPWNIEVEMARCEACGRAYAPENLLNFVQAKAPEHLSVGKLCRACRRTQTASRVTERSKQGKPHLSAMSRKGQPTRNGR